MWRFVIATVAVFAVASSSAAHAADCNWQGASGTAWHASTANWDCGVIPDEDDTVILTGTDRVLLTADEGVQALVLGATLQLAVGAGLTVSGTTTVSGGIVSGNGTLLAGGTAFSKGGPNPLTLDHGADLIVNAPATHSEGQILLQDGGGGDPTMQINGTYEVSAAGAAFAAGGGLDASRVTLGPTGTLIRSGTGTTTIAGFVNGGTVSVASGTARFLGHLSPTHTGAFTVQPGATLNWAAGDALGPTASLSGPGAVNIENFSTLSLADGAALTNLSALSVGFAANLAMDGTGPATTVPTLNLNVGQRTGTRDLTVGTLNTSGGTLSGDATTTVTGALSKTGADQLVLDHSADLVLNAPATHTEGRIHLQDSGGGDPTMQINAAYALSGTGDAFSAGGGLQASRITLAPGHTVTRSGSGTSQLSGLVNNGHVQVTGGSARVQNPVATAHAGTFTAAGGTTLEWASASDTVNASGAIAGPGNHQVNNFASLTLADGAALSNLSAVSVGFNATLAVSGTGPAATIPTLNLNVGQRSGNRNLAVGTLSATGGTLSGDASTTVTGAFTKSGSDQLILDNGADLVLDAPATHSEGRILLQDSGGGDPTVQINAAYALSVNGEAFGAGGGLQASRVTLGSGQTLTRSGSGPSHLAGFVNNGVLTVASGEAHVVNGLATTHTGVFAAQPLGALVLRSANDALVAPGTISGPGGVSIGNFSFFAVNDGAALTDISTLDVGLAAGLAVNGTSPAASIATLNLNQGTRSGNRALAVDTLTTTGGTITGDATTTVAGAFTKTGSDPLRLDNSADLVLNGPSTQNEGIVQFLDSGGGDPSFQIAQNYGIAMSGTAFTTAGGISTRPLRVLAGGTLGRVGPGSSTIGAATDNAGQVTAGSNQTLDFTEGYVQSHPAAVTTATGTLSGAITIAGGLLTGGGSLPGTVTLTGGSVSPDAGTLSIGELTQGGGTVTADPSETLAVTGARAQSGGTAAIASGGALTAASHAVSGGTTTVDGVLGGPISLTGGVLTGGGEITGNVTNTSGVIRPGSSPGLLAITGNFTQGAGGTLEIEIEGTAPAQFDRIAVSGTATLAGTVAILRPTGFDPVLTDTFQFMTSGSRSGTFTALGNATLPGSKNFALDHPAGGPLGARLIVQPPDPPANVSAPQITGTLAVGQTVACNPGSWSGNPTFAFAWLIDDQVIPGETASTYTISGADATRQLTCRVTGQNLGGTSAPATSAPRSVPAVAPANTQPPQVTGTAAVGQTLTCAPGTWTGAPAATISHEWLRGSQPIAGQTQPTYTVVAGDVLEQITCRETASNAGGIASATASAVAIPAVPPAGQTAPRITGAAAAGSPLTCDTGAWSGIPAPALSIAWLRDGVVIPAATGPTYTPTAADEGHEIACRVTATNAGGSTAATSAAQRIPVPAPALPAAEAKLVDAAPSQVAAAFGLPTPRRCLSRRVFTIRLSAPRGVTISRARVYVAGRLVKVRRSGKRFIATVDLRGRERGRIHVRIQIRTSNGSLLKGERRYRTCVPKRRAGR